MLLLGCGKHLPVDQVKLTPATSTEVLQVVRNSVAKVVLVNMWATWCGPCREEFPDLVRLNRDYAGRGLKIIFVSWDLDKETARKFLAQQGVDFPSYIKTDDESDQKFIENFEPKWSGALPATFIFDGTGQLRRNWEGKAAYEKFEQSVGELLSK